jgi:hypothetical protein
LRVSARTAEERGTSSLIGMSGGAAVLGGAGIATHPHSQGEQQGQADAGPHSAIGKRARAQHRLQNRLRLGSHIR